MNKLIQEFEAAQLKRDLPKFGPGDTVVVNVKVKEGARERIQAYEGVVIAKRNRGLHSAFTVRKNSYGTGVERVFQTHSRQIDSIEVKRYGDVRAAKLYYLRELEGRKARIREDLDARNQANKEAKEAALKAAEEARIAAEEKAKAEEEARIAAEAQAKADAEAKAKEEAEAKAKAEAEAKAAEEAKAKEEAAAEAEAPAAEEAAPADSGFDADAAKAVYGKKIKQDDLTFVEGIGPKIAELFQNEGIATWAALGECSVERCTEVLATGGDKFNMHSPDTWPKQAKLAAEGKWEELKKWQDELDGGRAAE